MPTCEECRYWKFSEEGSEKINVRAGFCYRYPMMIAPDPNRLTFFDDWCGEFERPPAVLKPLTQADIDARKAEREKPVTDEQMREKFKTTIPTPKL